MKFNEKNPNAKMNFIHETLKNNLWIGLIAKTSKIAPRHVRLAMMYLYTALHITFLTLIYAFNVESYVFPDMALFQYIFVSCFCIFAVWVITIPVALIFRMPMEVRRKIAGVRSKKINKAFAEVDALMGMRHATGYFICLLMYFVMTVVVLVFNTFYPSAYMMNWAINLILIILLDLIAFTFGLAFLQMGNVIISMKVRCWYRVWAAIEIFRYIKNIRG